MLRVRHNKRTLQWMKSWEDWYCWQCKEKSIDAILNTLIEATHDPNEA